MKSKKIKTELGDKRLGLFLHKAERKWDVTYAMKSRSDGPGFYSQSKGGRFSTHSRPHISTLIQMLLKK